MKRVYVVIASAGRYEDHGTRMVRAFGQEDAARAFARRAQNELNAALNPGAACCNKKLTTKFCPHCGKKSPRVDPDDVQHDPGAYGLTADTTPDFRGDDRISYDVESVEME